MLWLLDGETEFLKEDGRSCSSLWIVSLITVDSCMPSYQGGVVAGVCREDGHVRHYRRDPEILGGVRKRQGGALATFLEGAEG